MNVLSMAWYIRVIEIPTPDPYEVCGFFASMCLLYKPIMVAIIRKMHIVFALSGIIVPSGGLSRSIRL